MGGNSCGLLSLGENDDALYISDYYGQDGYVVLKCDVKTGLLTRVCGINRKVKETWSLSLADLLSEIWLDSSRWGSAWR